MPFLIAAALAGMAIPHRLPSTDVARSRIAACGIAGRRIRFVYENDLQENVAWIGRGSALSHATFDCLASVSLSSAYTIHFDDQQSEASYRPFYQRAEAVFSREISRRWLRNHGLLATLPHFNPARESVMIFAERLERYCGAAPGSMLIQLRPNFLTVRRDWLERGQGTDQMEGAGQQLACLMYSVEMTGLEEHGVRFGFLGNEAVSNMPER